MKPPIPDPFSNPKAPKDTRVFRMDFWRSFLPYGCALGVFFLPYLWWRFSPLFRRSTSLDPLLVCMAIITLMSLVCATINLFYAVKVGQLTLQGFNFWWTAKREVPWDEITRVRGFWLLFPFAVISTARRRGFIWLPLNLSDMPGFVRAVEEVAPEDHPLRLFLRKRNF